MIYRTLLKVFSFFSGILFFFIPSISFAQTAGIVGHWAFDEGSGTTASDSSGNSLNGTINSATWTTGRIGSALNFPGNSYVNLGSPAVLDNLSTFTWSAWVNPSTLTGVQNPIMEKGSGSDRKKTFYMSSSSGSSAGRVIAQIKVGTTNAYSESVNNTYTLNAWDHWAIVYDDSGDRKIHIYKNGIEVSYATQTSANGALVDDATDNLYIGATPDTMFYSFNGGIDDVHTYNRTLSLSEIQSLASGGTTPPPALDTSAPSTPTGLIVTAISQTQINLSWSASTDNVGVAGYRIFRNGTQITTTTGTSYSNTGLTAGTTYAYTVQATDAAGNSSAQSTAVSGTTQSSTPIADISAPSMPLNLSASAVSSSQINLNWSTSTDNIGVTGYNIYRSGTQIASVVATSYSDSFLAASTAYSYTVQAYDAAGNNSAQSTAVFATTQSVSTSPPTSSGTGAPVIFYSDLDSGPNTGGENNNGVYVTINGNNFGSTQGTVTVGGGTVAGYKLWTNNKIIFQLGANAQTGNIVVTTSTGTSNGMPFTVRPGNIYFVTPTGTGNGLSVSTPMSPSAAYVIMGPGKTFYFRGGTYGQNYSGGGIYGYTNYSIDQAHGGTSGLPLALVGYPGETTTWTISDPSRFNFLFNNNTTPANYITLANHTIIGGSSTINDGGFYANGNSGGVHNRIINNVLSAGYGTANTMTGLIVIQNNYWKVLGNEFKDTGTGTPINNNHAVYNQAGSSYTEIAWNYFHDLRMGGVVQVHTDPFYSYYGVSIHDNVFAQGTNGDSRAIVIGNTNGDSYGYIYNNIFDRIGSGYGAIGIWSGTWKIYNNTMYNIHAAGSQMVWVTNAARVNFGAPSSWLPGPNVDIKNNIFYSDGSTPYFSISTSVPAPVYAMDHNLYYNNGAAPIQDTAPITVNPLFVSPTIGDFHLQSTSPAKDSGTSNNVSAVVLRDHDSLSRPQGLAYDIGAYEYASGGTTPPPTPLPTITLSASPTSVTSGGSTTISWSTTNATSCTASGGWSGTKTTSGTQTLTNLTTTGTYTLSCTGTGGTTNASATVTVTAPQTCTTFTYSTWGSCQSNNTQTRTTTSTSPQGCTGGTPVLTQSCVYTPPSPPTQTTCTTFTYSAWDICQSNNTQSRTTTSTSPQGCTGGTPILSQSCTYTPPVTPPPSGGGGGTSSGGGGGGGTTSGGTTSSSGSSSGSSGGTSTASSGTSGGGTTSGGTTGGGTTTTSGGTTTPTTQPTFPTLTGPFSIGMNNEQVKLLQQMLIKDGSLGGEATGYYGPVTQKGVETFQTKYNLVSGGSPSTTGFGLAGPGTRAKLNQLYAQGGNTADREALIASLRKQLADLTALLQTLIAKLAAIKAAKGIQ